MKHLVITGVNGFVGGHLARIAAESGWSVTGYSTGDKPRSEIAEYLEDFRGVDLREAWPDSEPGTHIIHLAGLAAVGASFDSPQAYINGNSAMVTHMCEWLLASGWSGRLIGVSSGALYSSLSATSVHSESAPIGMTSPYVVSKVLVENQLDYYRGRGIDAVVARPFNHIGPGQGPGFLVPDLVTRLRALPPGGALDVGNLATRRDYSDVRDVARAYLALATAPTLADHVYNVASGVSRSGHELLQAICAADDRPIPELRTDPKRLRPNDPESIVGDTTRIRAAVDWRPQVALEQTIADVLAS